MSEAQGSRPSFPRFYTAGHSPNRLEFDYRLRPGVAPSRNAIALLQLLGAPPEVADDAQARADRVAVAISDGAIPD
jgi:DNA mismatch repair ATPase MutS